MPVVHVTSSRKLPQSKSHSDFVCQPGGNEQIRNAVSPTFTTGIWADIKNVADIGTKALDVKNFVFFRDLLSGYALVQLRL
jgi:hypothetical protein